MNVSELLENLRSEEYFLVNKTAEEVEKISKEDPGTYSILFPQILSLIEESDDLQTVLRLSAVVRNGKINNLDDVYPNIIQTLQVLVKKYPMDEDSNYDSAVASNLFQVIKDELVKPNNISGAMPLLLEYMGKKSYIRSSMLGYVNPLSQRNPKLLVPYVDKLFELARGGLLDAFTPLLYLYTYASDVYEQEENLSFLVNLGTRNDSYASLAFNLIQEVAKKKPVLLIPHIQALKSALETPTTALGATMVINEVAKKNPSVVKPLVPVFQEAVKTIPNLKYYLPGLLGFMGRQSKEAAAENLVILSTFFDDPDQNIQLQVLLQVKNLGEMDRELLTPYIERVKSYVEDPQQYIRDTAKSIMDFYEGRDVSSLLAKMEELNKEMKESVANIDDLRGYVDEHMAEFRNFLAEIVKKMPIPAKFTSEGRLLKTLKLHFVCGCHGDRCLFPEDRAFETKTREINKWVKVAVSAVKAGVSIAQTSVGDAIFNVRDMYVNATGREDKEFLAIANEPFLTSSEQDYLISQLRKERFFDFFNYDAQTARWCCMMCQPPKVDNT